MRAAVVISDQCGRLDFLPTIFFGEMPGLHLAAAQIETFEITSSPCGELSSGPCLVTAWCSRLVRSWGWLQSHTLFTDRFVPLNYSGIFCPPLIYISICSSFLHKFLVDLFIHKYIHFHCIHCYLDSILQFQHNTANSLSPNLPCLHISWLEEPEFICLEVGSLGMIFLIISVINISTWHLAPTSGAQWSSESFRESQWKWILDIK